MKLIEKNFKLLPDSLGTYTIWRQMVESHHVIGVQVHDAKIAAAMKQHGVPRLLTLNASDFKRFPSVLASSPAEVIAQSGKV